MKDKLTAAEFQRYIKTGKIDETQPKKNKYGNKRCVIDGLKFDSIREGNRFGVLMLLHKAGKISKPILQYEFVLQGGNYLADFVYFDYEKKEFIVEDSKGCRTDVYKLKRKKMIEMYGITILET